MDKNKDIDVLIDELSDDLNPVKKLFCPVFPTLPWVIVSIAYIGGVVHFLGVRMDFAKKMQEPAFMFELGLTGAIAVAAAYAAGFLAIPDMREKKWLLSVPVTLFGVFMLWTFCRIITEGFLMPEISWHHCFSDAMLMAFVPVAVLCLLVKRGATTRPGWMSFMSTLSVGALGWGALRITCMAENTGHIMMFHFLPFILIAAVLGVLARRIYSW